jgi:hypothetical protein
MNFMCRDFPSTWLDPGIPFIHLNATKVGSCLVTYLHRRFPFLLIVLSSSICQLEDWYCFSCSFCATSLLVMCAALVQPLYPHHVYLLSTHVGDQSEANGSFSDDSFVCIHFDKSTEALFLIRVPSSRRCAPQEDAHLIAQ